MKSVYITTIDNPFNPAKDFDNWYRYDCDRGYNSCGKLARIANTSDQLTEKENQEELERAIDEIIRIDPLKLYTKVYSDDENSNESL